MKLHFQNRVAFFNTVAASIIIAFVYCIIYMVVFVADHGHLNKDIRKERDLVLNNLEYSGDSIIINKLAQWQLREKESFEANPVFIQILNRNGNTIYRSGNLLHYSLITNNATVESFFNVLIENEHFKQGQFIVYNRQGVRTGIVLVAISREESFIVLKTLILILCLSYPLLIIGLYFFILFSVSKAISPVRNLIKSASAINDTNINLRMPLPAKEDEIFQLATTINELLDRIEKSMKNQKQFTADASHEMRTPLTAIRGILEVLVRKTRDPDQYEKGIKKAIIEVDRMHLLMEQLLQLARLSAGVVPVKQVPVFLYKMLTELEYKWKRKLNEQNISLHLNVPKNAQVHSDNVLLELIIENLVSNAIKYGRLNGNIYISWQEKNNTLGITDDGIGISSGQLPHLFERFYRTDNSRNSRVPGNGLGLSIVKKISDLLKINIKVMSNEGKGTSFTLQFSPLRN